MEAPKTLRRPANWQDFETLCKKLWGEIWHCSDIQKNGRLGQNQSGVDVFGIPEGENAYYGIQCKGKNEYSNSQFTEKEILEEIEKAKLFDPRLKKYYLTTTAENDATIQAFVRKKNLEHKANGLFEIHLYAWEAIVDLIDENKQTHDWYVKSQNYKTNHSVSVTFENGLTEIECYPQFKEITRTYKIRTSSKGNDIIGFSPYAVYGPAVNLSYYPISLVIANTGTEPIEEFKIHLAFEGEILGWARTNDHDKYPTTSQNLPSDITLNSDSFIASINPKQPILVSDDVFKSAPIFIKPPIKQSQISVQWKLLSKSFKSEGKLTINMVPQIKKETWTLEEDYNYQIKPDSVSMEDYIAPKN